MVGAVTPFGLQFDSLADLVSFGLAPALLAFTLFSEGRDGWDPLGWVACFLWVACAAIRLARFNASIDPTADKRYFIGMPSPGAAGVVLASVFAFGDQMQGRDRLWVLLVIAVPALLMVSNIRFRSFRSLVSPHSGKPYGLVAVALLLVVAFALAPVVTGIVLAYGYLFAPLLVPLVSPLARLVPAPVKEASRERPTRSAPTTSRRPWAGPRARRLRAGAARGAPHRGAADGALFGRSPALFGHVAEDDDGEVVGVALWFLNFSTWRGTHGIYLEDLYVQPGHRGAGWAGSCSAPWPRSAWNAATRAWSGRCWTGTPRRSGSTGPPAPSRMDDWTVFRLTDDALTGFAAPTLRPRAPRQDAVTTERVPPECWLTDMDGVLVHEEKALPGAAEFLERLVEREPPLPGADQQLDLHAARPRRPAGARRACTSPRSRSGPRRWPPRTSCTPSCPAARPTSSARPG